MQVIGLTGGIGTGKSEVSRILGTMGAVVISADLLGHEAYKPYSRTWQKVVNAFGKQVIGPTGHVDRKRIAATIFSDPKARAKLNSIVHPQIAKIATERIEELRRQGVDIIVLEAAILIEAGWDSLVDEVWVTHATEQVVVERLKKRDNLSEKEIGGRINAQLAYAERAKHGDVIIDNTGSFEDLHSRIAELWKSRYKEGLDDNA